MNKILLASFFFTLSLVGCTTKYQPLFLSEIEEIEVTELAQYWTPIITKTQYLKGRPDWLPKGGGRASYFVTIDSNGVETSKVLIESNPKGWMKQKFLNKMPIGKYSAAELNISKTPVKFKVVSEIKRVM